MYIVISLSYHEIGHIINLNYYHSKNREISGEILKKEKEILKSGEV